MITREAIVTEIHMVVKDQLERIGFLLDSQNDLGKYIKNTIGELIIVFYQSFIFSLSILPFIIVVILIAHTQIILSQTLIDCNSFNEGSYCYELKLDKDQKKLDKLEGQKTSYFVIIENHGTDSVKIYRFTFINKHLFSFTLHFKVPQGVVMSFNEIVSDGNLSSSDSLTFDIALSVKISGDNRISFYVPPIPIVHDIDPMQQLASYFSHSISNMKLIEGEGGVSKDSITRFVSTSFYEQAENVYNSLNGDGIKSNPNSGANYCLLKYYQIFNPFEDNILMYSEGLSFAFEIKLMSMKTDTILELIQGWEMSSKLPYVFTAYKVLYFRTSLAKYLEKYQEYRQFHEKLMQEDPLNYKALLESD